MFPTNLSRLVRTRILSAAECVTYLSSAVWIENPSFQSGSLNSRCGLAIVVNVRWLALYPRQLRALAIFAAIGGARRRTRLELETWAFLKRDFVPYA